MERETPTTFFRDFFEGTNMQRPRSDGRRPGSNHRGRLQRSEPRRPNTTPKPRIQRLLPTPGQNLIPDCHNTQQSTNSSPTQLIRLPDSPPRSLSMRPIEYVSFSNETDTTRDVNKAVAIEISTADPDKMHSVSSDSKLQARANEESMNLLSVGPLPKDISPPDQDKHQNLKDTQPESSDDDDDYKQAVDSRKRLLDDEAERKRIRDELETYVDSLSSRTDENGEHLVEFPRNYQQIVSLMTQKDVNEVEPASLVGQQTRQSWSRVLIESGLSKQQAFGILEDVDDDPDSSSLAAKIALKMARIRQLDAILEEKLGKNLYASIVPRKQKPPQRKIPQENSGNRTFVTQTQASTLSKGGETSRSSTSCRQSSVGDDERAKKTSNFIERNKQVVANGMKANMTKDEEDRLEKLLRDEPTSDDASSEESAKPEVETECNEFMMNDDEKQAIEELIATKSGAYPLFAIDELQDGPTEDVLKAKDNIIQETKRERLQRRRLSRVEQELRFLQESPSVVIVGDDHEEENDDCRSEVSFTTVASSTYSTRSGVISRHDFKCFLAQQKESFCSTPTASADEIRKLLLSINHTTATTAPTV